MKRLLISCVIALPVLALAAPALAEVKTREKSQIKIEGMIGRMMNMFGGKAAREGIVSTVAVKGSRKATVNDVTGQIIDLSEEKIYDLDMKKKTYEVTTFEELRRRMREAREKAQKDAEKEPGKEPEKSGEPQKEFEVDFDAKETGQKKPLAGYDTREVIMTITVREKGKTLEDGGGFVMTADSWLGPQIAALKEVADFDQRYWKQLQGPEAMGMSAEQMAMVMAMYPMLKQASERLAKEGAKLTGHAARDHDDLRGREVQGADVAAGRGSQVRRRRLQRHARAEARQERGRRQAARHDLHGHQRNAGSRDERGADRHRPAGWLQREEVDANSEVPRRIMERKVEELRRATPAPASRGAGFLPRFQRPWPAASRRPPWRGSSSRRASTSRRSTARRKYSASTSRRRKRNRPRAGSARISTTSSGCAKSTSRSIPSRPLRSGRTCRARSRNPARHQGRRSTCACSRRRRGMRLWTSSPFCRSRHWRRSFSAGRCHPPTSPRCTWSASRRMDRS